MKTDCEEINRIEVEKIGNGFLVTIQTNIWFDRYTFYEWEEVLEYLNSLKVGRR